MPNYVHPELGDRPEWILRILYTPGRGNPEIPIVGNTRIMKACFLVHRTLSSEFDIETDFKFHAADYGPLDPLVYDALEHLEEQGLIETSKSEKYSGTKYDLTDLGGSEAKELFEELAPEVQEHMEWLKSKHILDSLPKLLSFVYNRYPKMARRSKLT